MRTTNILYVILCFAILNACSKEEEVPTPPMMPEITEMPEMPGMPEIPDPIDTMQIDIPNVDEKVEAFLERYDLPGGSLAVTKNEKLVYTKGFGIANIETGEAVDPDHSFRIASVSKMFTAIGILNLVQDDKIELTDKVFGDDGILGDNYGRFSVDERIYDITVDHLLYNTCGGWGVASGGDPIDYEPHLNAEDFISYVFDNWELKYSPGDEFVYSNTGYFLLARIIEKVSRKDYIDYLNDILEPTGITTLRTTTFKEDDIQDNEVRYYGQNDEQQWVYKIASRRDGDGGIVISSPDLLRVICAIDGFGHRSDILNSEMFDLFKQPSNALNIWGRGIGVWSQKSLLYTNGSLPGNRSWVMWGDNGISVSLLCNSRADHIEDFANAFQSLILEILEDENIAWQTELDQFN